LTAVDVIRPESAAAPPGTERPISPRLRGTGRQAGVVVCRGCCCGDGTKNPGTDHAGQLSRLRRFAESRPAEALVRTTPDCLGPCAQANVMVVRPSAVGRRHGGRPVWLGLVRDQTAVELIETWLCAGGPGAAPIPASLALQMIASPAGRTRPGDDGAARRPTAGMGSR